LKAISQDSPAVTEENHKSFSQEAGFAVDIPKAFLVYLKFQAYCSPYTTVKVKVSSYTPWRRLGGEEL
jgi:hypothetical protein